MRIGELSQKTGLSVDTLRYYEKIGLIAPPWRDNGQRRDYDDGIFVWLSFLKALKATGMKLSDMETYARLRSVGPETSAERREMLERQRSLVVERVAELQDCLNMLDFKIENYREIEARHALPNSTSIKSLKGTRQ